MYEQIYQSDNFAFTLIFALFFFLLGVISGFLVMVSYEKGRAILNATVAFANMLTGVICGLTFLAFIDNIPFELYPLAFLNGFATSSILIALTARKKITKELTLAKEISAQASSLHELRDNDKDGVISSRDLEAAGETAVRYGIREEVVEHLRDNMSSIGHAVDSSAYVVSLIDLTSLETRRLDKYKAWLLVSGKD